MFCGYGNMYFASIGQWVIVLNFVFLQTFYDAFYDIAYKLIHIGISLKHYNLIIISNVYNFMYTYIVNNRELSSILNGRSAFVTMRHRKGTDDK